MSTVRKFTDSILSKDAEAVLKCFHGNITIPTTGADLARGDKSCYIIEFEHQTNSETGEYIKNIVSVVKNDMKLTIENLDKGIPELLGKVGLTPEDHFRKEFIASKRVEKHSAEGTEPYYTTATTRYNISKESVEAIKAAFQDQSKTIER